MRANGWLAAWLSAWAAIFLWQVAWLQPPAGGLAFNSPDELANHFFASRVAAGAPLPAPAPLNGGPGGIVHPRGMAVFNGTLVPLSFIGLPVWYGLIGRLLQPGLIVFLTPLLTVLGGLALHRLLRDVFGPSVATIALLLLPLLPPWWYYTVRSMFHHVPFLVFLTVALALGATIARGARLTVALLAGASLGLALSLRTVEAVWVVPLVLTCLLWHPPARRWWWAITLGAVAVFLPVLMVQAQTYGAFWRFGYLLPPAVERGPRDVLDLLPFGIHPRRAARNALAFTVKLVPALTLPALAGIALELSRWRTLSQLRRRYLAGYLAVSIWLVLYYGSAQLSDNVTPGVVSLGISYVRYWLPLYVGALPFTVLAFRWLADRWQRVPARHATVAVLLLAAAGWSVHRTWFDPEGIAAVRQALAANVRQRVAVAPLVPPEAVIVAERADKLFFPTFPVVPTLADPAVQRHLPALVSRSPVYYYSYFGDGAIARLSAQLNPLGLELVDPVPVGVPPSGPERLWRVRAR